MAALYDPRYDYPYRGRQSFIGSLRDLDKRNEYLRLLHPDTVPPAQAAPALTPSHLTGTKGDMHGYVRESIRDSILDNRPERLLPPPAQATPALQTSAAAEPKAALEHPKPYMHSAIANDPLLQLMAGGNKKRLGPVETYRFFKTLDPAVQQQHASRIDGSHLAKLEKREAMGGGGTEYGNLDGTVTAGAGDQNESGDPVDDLQEREIARLLEVERMKRINNPLGGTGGALTDTSEISDLINKTDNFGSPALSGSNRLTNILSGLSRDAIGFAEDVIANGISVTYNGNEIFATDGENTVPVTKETAAAINDANNGGDEPALSQQNGPYFPEMPVAPPALAPAPQDNNNNGGTGPVLRQPTSNAASTGNAARRMTGGYTGNARGSALPDMQIGLGERLMRMGAAGMAAGGQGGLAQMGAMFGASADVNQANRQAEMEAFGIEEERRQAHAARVAALAASKNKGAGDGDLSFDTANQINNMQMALSALKSGALTGVWDAGVKGWMDKYGMTDDFNELTGFLFGGEKGIGARRAHIRNILQNIKVDGALAKAANTKGAISDTEMALFLSPFPTQFQDEGVWIEMLEEKLRILQKIQGSSGSSSQPVKVGTATVTLLP